MPERPHSASWCASPCLPVGVSALPKSSGGVTFSPSADSYKRLRAAHNYVDLNMLPLGSDEPVLFLGGKGYLPLFERLTRGARGDGSLSATRRLCVVFQAAGCSAS